MPPRASASRAIDLRQLLSHAITKADGVRALARTLHWNLGSIAKVKAGQRLPPFRAIQLAALTGSNPEQQDRAMFTAMMELSKSNIERDYWKGRLMRSGGVET